MTRLFACVVLLNKVFLRHTAIKIAIIMKETVTIIIIEVIATIME